MRATTKAVKKKLPSAFPARTKAVKCFYCNGSGAVQSLALSLSSGESYRQRETSQAERKKIRELKREVTRLNALVIKLAEKI